MTERITVGVIGAGGFIGSRLVEWLVLRELADVRPIVRSFTGLARTARFELDSRLADATDQSTLQLQLKGCQIIFHCVAGGRKTILKSIEATYCAAAAVGVRRLVYLSGAVVHGHNPPPGTDEDSKISCRQAFEYNVSKVLAERRLAHMHRDGKVEIVVLRPSIVFGPRSQYWTANIATDLIHRRAYLVERGSGICNTIYIDNLVYAMWLAATRPGAANHTFLVTDGERVTWRDLYASIAVALGIDPNTIANLSIGEVKAIESAAMWNQKLKTAYSILKKVGKAARKRMPTRLKNLAGGVRFGMAPAPSFSFNKNIGPIIDLEIASLQQCGYMLPIGKARSLLGYQPPLGFEEATHRTAAWLRSALGFRAPTGIE